MEAAIDLKSSVYVARSIAITAVIADAPADRAQWGHGLAPLEAPNSEFAAV